MTIELFKTPAGGTITYVSRSTWGGGPLRRGHVIPADRFKGLVLHHTPQLPKAMGIKRPTNVQDITEAVRFMRRLQEIRPDLGNEVPYSWIILRGHTDADAIVCEGRGDNRTGAHTAGMNSKRYGVAIAQNANDHPMTPGQVAAFRWIGATSLTASNLEPTTQHRDWAHVNSLNNTECASSAKSLPALQPPFTDAPATTTATPTATAAAVASAEALPVLDAGDAGPAVREYQLLVNVFLELIDRATGRNGGRLVVSGIMDAATVKLTERFQHWAQIDVDGVVGNLETRPALYRALAVASASAIRAEFHLAPIRPHPGEFGNLADPWRTA